MFGWGVIKHGVPESVRFYTIPFWISAPWRMFTSILALYKCFLFTYSLLDCKYTFQGLPSLLSYFRLGSGGYIDIALMSSI